MLSYSCKLPVLAVELYFTYIIHLLACLCGVCFRDRELYTSPMIIAEAHLYFSSLQLFGAHRLVHFILALRHRFS